jgi:hypothetical protein
MKKQGVTTSGILIGVTVVVALVLAIIALLRFDTTGSSGNRLGQEYTYDVDDLGQIDPNLILYEQVGDPIPTGFVHSRCIVAYGSAIYVGGDQAVNRFNVTGEKAGSIALDDEIQCLAVGVDGTLVVGHKAHVEVYTAAGERLAKWETLGEQSILTSIALYETQVFVADAGNRVVWHYDVNGKRLGSIGKRDDERNVPGFIIPSPYFDLAVSADDLLRVVSPGRRRIEAYTFGGDFEFAWGTTSTNIKGFCGCCNPVNFAIGPDGEYVTCEKGIVRVKVYDYQGVFQGVVAGPEQLTPGVQSRVCETPDQCQSNGFDVAVDEQGHVYVLDTVEQVVRVFKRKDK